MVQPRRDSSASGSASRCQIAPTSFTRPCSSVAGAPATLSPPAEPVCNVCSSHLGHIFRGEGWALPAPAERHCVNGRSLIFDPANLSDGEYAVETGEDDDVDEADDDDAYEWGEDDEGDESGSAVVDEDIGISDPDELKDR